MGDWKAPTPRTLPSPIVTGYWNKEILVLGCGNVLFGDDGFGPAVAGYLEQSCEVPSHVGVVNAGSAVRDLLFTVALNERRPRLIIIVDAVDDGMPPGEVRERDISEFREVAIGDSSMHLFPTTRLLRELSDLRGIEVKVISVQVLHAPHEVRPGLSDVVQASIPAVCERILALLRTAPTT
ncbi:MAG: hydrogenase maturation protease [Gemmatimonadales bacterium]|nr:hydrogenase maturation protease [Gemmatimonadales bacterium]